jgi:light-regulated signal transduction histidine kinase (bacteriophytochrome)
VHEALPELKGSPFLQILDDVFTSGKSFEAAGAEVQLVVDNILSTYYYDFVYTPLFDSAGAVYGILTTAVNVTEQILTRKKIEESEAELQKRVEIRTKELATAINELKRSNSHLEEFAHAASHDLKEPIRKIHFFTNRLKNQLSDKLNPEDERMFNRVENASQRMNTLIDDLLLYSHVTHKPHEKERIDLNEIISRLLEDLELEIDEKAAKIIVDNLPVVQGYKRQLQQLFHNLLTNALKYSQAGIAPLITIKSTLVKGTEDGLNQYKNYHLITVKDNGIGFGQEQAEKIFQMFQRLHGKNEYEGTGVGLSIARKVAENHNGKITAKSEKGEGASFNLYLPME